MSKWKSGALDIKHAFYVEHLGMLGLGEDNKLYNWDHDKGAWEKFWKWQEVDE